MAKERKVYTWIQLDEEPAANFPMTLYYMGMALASKSVGSVMGPIALIYKGRSVRECVVKNGLVKPGEAILEKLNKDRKFIPWMRRITYANAKKVLVFSTKLSKMDFSQLSNQKLCVLYKRWTELALATLTTSTYGTVLEFEEPLLSGPLYTYLQDTAAKKYTDNVGTIFSILTTPVGDNENRTAELALITIVQKHRKKVPRKKWGSDKVFFEYLRSHQPKLLKELRAFHDRFSYLSYGYSGPKKDFTETLNDFLRHRNQPSDLLRKKIIELTRADYTIRKLQDSWGRVLGLDSEHLHLFSALRDIGGLKRWRKKLMVRCQFLVHGLLDEIANRMTVPLLTVQSIAPWEMEKAFLKKGFSKLQLRAISRQTVIWIYNHKWHVLSSHEAAVLIRDIKRSLNVRGTFTELHGMCACAGKVIGHVKILRNSADLSKFEAGEIIVSPATSPELVPAMRRASAIITDAGGITSHAAIVSRELGVPCIIGTKIATQVLKDGDKVEVDANKGIVRKL